MQLNNPEDAVPWVGLYVCLASLVCTLAMAADAFQGFRKRKIWFPCRFFTLNAASITVIAIAMKLPVDLTTIKPNLSTVMHNTDDVNAKVSSILFLITMLANFLPSFGLMNDRELLFNILALGILIITIIVNVCIQMATHVFYVHDAFNLVPVLFTFSVALTVPASRRILEHQYRELHELDSNNQEISFSSKGLVHTIKKYWMMSETGNPQFVIACSPISCAIGVVCLFNASQVCGVLVAELLMPSYFSYGRSDYKWSIKLIITMQFIGVLVGSIAPTFRCVTSISYFKISKNWSAKHLNMFRVERQWTQKLHQWKRSHIHSHIPGRYCKIAFQAFKNGILNFFIALQIMFVIICKIISLFPKSCLILFSCGWYFFKSWLKNFKKAPNVSNTDANSEIKEYTRYALQIEDDAEFSERVTRDALKSITQLLQVSNEESINLLKLLHKSTRFDGVKLFHNDQVPPLHAEETKNSWSLVTVTLTAIALALPNIANNHIEGLLASMNEGLKFVRHVEESLNPNTDLVKARKAAKSVWTEVEVYRTWLQIDLQKKAHRGRKSKEILQWLGDEAVKIVIQLKICKKQILDHSLYKFLAAGSMYKSSQSILLHFNEQEKWPNDEEVFEWISIVIADVLCACLTNLPRVIKMKCHHDAIEKRRDNIRSAALLLGKSKKILKILKARQLPHLDMDSMACIDKWHGYTSSNRVQPASLNSDKLLIVSIMK
uniref:uncharacterized protein LOC122595399 n=1 Tax=Erigeron canadensis TaxID=72917 RepID=UPI001CB892D2|nr:uncharacterized protein LOC122595399 [Erigeron canadensis]